jgi:putative FmdB family regulatory protein
MPNYDYQHVDARGPDCDEVFEVFQAMADDALTECPACGKPVQKIFSAVAGKVNKLATSNIKKS